LAVIYTPVLLLNLFMAGDPVDCGGGILMGSKKILLVDNASQYRETVRDFLDQQGYQVLTAPDLETARNIFEKDRPDLAVPDIRLMDLSDEKDVSGLALAKETDPSIPKIFLTAFPSFEVVREALVPTPNGFPLAVGFVAKQERLYKLLDTIELALWRPNPLYEANLLRAFNADSLDALRVRLDEIGPHEFIHRFQESAEAAAASLAELRDFEERRASVIHTTGLIAGVVWIILILSAFAVLLMGALRLALLLLVAGIAIYVARMFVLMREKQANERVRSRSEELDEVRRDLHLFDLTNEIDSRPTENKEQSSQRKAADRPLATPTVRSRISENLIREAVREVLAEKGSA
jgi:CheY-like chemotaxis protein